MKRAFLPLALFAMAMAAHAQQQEQGMLDRIDANWRKGIDAMGGQTPGKKGRKAKADPALTSEFQSKKFEGTTFASKSYDTGAFQGTKSAELKTFETRSFFGIKNPWFGRKVFATDKSSLAGREAEEAKRDFQAGAYSTDKYSQTGKKDELTANTVLPTAATPREYRGPEKSKKDGIDKFTQNLSKDLSIDDVRDLLNKGKGE